MLVYLEHEGYDKNRHEKSAWDLKVDDADALGWGEFEKHAHRSYENRVEINGDDGTDSWIFWGRL